MAGGATTAALALVVRGWAVGDRRGDTNMVAGMRSGLALLMDVHLPERPNGIGLVHVSGSGWSAPLSLALRSLKEAGHARIEALALGRASLY